MGPKKLLPLGTFMKVPNMNHCTADARRAFPVLLRESPSDWNKLGGLSRGGLSVSDGCTVLHGRYDLMLLFLLFLPRSMGGPPRLILHCHLLAPRAGDLCSCQLQLHQLRQPLVNCGYAGKDYPAAPPTPVQG